MDRRRYLRVIGAGSVAALAGCSSRDGGGGDGTSGGDDGSGSATATTTTTTGGNGAEDTTTSSTVPDYDEVELPISRDQLTRGARQDAIPAITEPAFAADWGGMDGLSLEDGDRVIGVVREGEARAYPLRILNWHEICNDEFHGPLLVSFCPLCGSGLTAERTVQGEPTNFGVSGFLYQSDLVMYDEATDSLWSQILATAINGELTGTTLTLVPSTLTTWGSWREDHPDTEVLLPPPESGTIVDARPRNYARQPYAGYEDSDRIGIGANDFDDDRLHPKAQVIGVATDEVARAYPFETVREEGVINDTVGDLPVVVAAGPDGTMVAYERRVDGETLEFEAAGERRMSGGNSTWTITSGRAVDGPHEGTRLSQASDATTMFWFAWADFNPETEIYGRSSDE